MRMHCAWPQKLQELRIPRDTCRYAYVRQSQLQVDVLCSFRKALHNFGKIFDQDFVPALEVREVPGVRTNRKQLPPCDHP